MGIPRSPTKKLAICKGRQQAFRNRQIFRRIDTHETIVAERFATFRYCQYQEVCRSDKCRAEASGKAAGVGGTNTRLPQQRAWCRQQGVTAATYYRWERELLAAAGTVPQPKVPTVTFAELPAPQQVSRKAAERSATLHIGEASLDIYPGCDAEQLKTLVELLRLC